MTSTRVYQHAEVRTVVLRPTNVVGPRIQNAMSRLLLRERIASLAGYNPMSQLVHEDDLARAIIAASSGQARGVYNVVGGAAVPWRTALDLVGAKTFPSHQASSKATCGPSRASPSTSSTS